MDFTPEEIKVFEKCDRDVVFVDDSIKKVEWDNIEDIKFLDEGKFGHVRLVRLVGGFQSSEFTFAIDYAESEDDESKKEEEEEEAKEEIQEFFASKYLNLNSHDPLDAAKQLAHEARILSGLDHENIIKLRGVCANDFAESLTNGSRGYFLLLDHLDGTLLDLLNQRRKEQRNKPKFFKKLALKSSSFRKSVVKRISLIPGHVQRPDQVTTRRSSMKRLSSLSTVGEDKKPQSLSTKIVERLSFASTSSKASEGRDHRKRQRDMYRRIQELSVVGIAKGLEYLHSKNIVFRDLKPANIGYYRNSKNEWTVKLIDFGLATDVDECEEGKLCGSLGYISPEAMKGEKATLQTDVFSFGTVLTEICSLREPYDNFRNPKRLSMVEFYDDICNKVTNEGLRPMNDLEDILPCFGILAMVQDCWETPENRPAFSDIVPRLDALLQQHKGGMPMSCDWTESMTEDHEE